MSVKINNTNIKSNIPAQSTKLVLTSLVILVAEKNLRGLEAQVGVLHKKIEEHVTVLCDYESQNKRTASENSMLFTK